MADNKPTVNFSQREMELLAKAWLCMGTQPKIDMNKLATLTGYTPGSASVTLGKLKQKIKVMNGPSSSSGGPSAPATPRKSTPRKPTTPKSATGKRGGSATADKNDASPSKRQKKKPLLREHTEEFEGVLEDEEDEKEFKGVKREPTEDYCEPQGFQ